MRKEEQLFRGHVGLINERMRVKQWRPADKTVTNRGTGRNENGELAQTYRTRGDSKK